MAITETGAAELSRENYIFLQQHVYKSSGIVLDDNKLYLLEARLLPIARTENVSTLNDLCALLRATGSGRILQAVRDAMTTNETLFFRDAVPFKVMRQNLIPELLSERNGSRRLVFWSAAASSGQEAYSLAMMLLDMGMESRDIEIVATDISDRVLDQARAGRYTQAEVGRGLPAQQLVKYFRRDHTEWQIKDEVRRLVRFQSFDLRSPMASLGTFDFILCRNVLIYFDIETKKRILQSLEYVMNPRAFLLLGGAETTLNLTDAFERRAFDAAYFYQKR